LVAQDTPTQSRLPVQILLQLLLLPLLVL